MAEHFIGIDVGTGSARAGVFDAKGTLLGVGKHDIVLFQEAGSIAEQSSEDIWSAVCRSVRLAIVAAGVDPRSIAGIGFDATCSLVVLGEGGIPISVSSTGDPNRNIIVWMDHRAREQAERINATRHPVLAYVGGRISPEMQTPKLLWLKEHLRPAFDGAWQFFDLPDFLTWRATGSLARTTCTVTCKWTYLAHERRWDPSYFETIGLAELANEGFARIGTEIVEAGTALGHGLTPAAAFDMGLPAGINVAASLIDAHAGGLGTVGASGGSGSVQSRMAYVFGTSACTMSTSPEPAFVDGIWGPYYSAMIPGYWLSEGGQSAAGAAIDQLVHLHPAAPEAEARAKAAGTSLVGWLSQEAAVLPSAIATVGKLHVVPEFLGNRAPFADPEARAVIAGLGMERSLESLLGLYVAGVVSLGYGVRQIVAASRAKGLVIDTIVVSGGAAQAPLVRQLLADSTGIEVAATAADEPVLLGAAILATLAADRYPDAATAMSAMSRVAHSYRPSPGNRDWHERRFAAFERLQLAARLPG
ncbi:MAG TPA: FGGY-family carbohydrate kinase [Devosia sp.]